MNGNFIVFCVIVCLDNVITIKAMHRGSNSTKSKTSVSQKILPNVCVFEYTGEDEKYKDNDFLVNIKQQSNGKISDIEAVTWNVDEIVVEPISANPVVAFTDVDTDKYLHHGQYYGMGIQEAWAKGYSGKGVVIAVTDVGVDKSIPDLAPNMKQLPVLHYNFINENKDALPEWFPDIPWSLPFTDHGNRCAGLIAAAKDNDICGSGIAYRANLVALKLFKVQMSGLLPSNSFSTDHVLKALSYKTEKIQIYSNSWTKISDFQGVSPMTKEVLLEGVKHGRQNKGSIFVFPSGPIAGGFSDSIHTISVGSVDSYGNVTARYMNQSAATLTSTFGEGTRMNMTYMVTTSHDRNKCTQDFQGTSASTAMVSGMIGLALEANNNLTWRDVQHLIVKASYRTELPIKDEFNRNGAGLYYHNYLGFGLLDAFHLVSLAEHWKSIGPQIIRERETQISNNSIGTRDVLDNTVTSNSTITIDFEEEDCLHNVDNIEHVEVKVSFRSPNENNLQITLTSPAGTRSMLMERGHSSRFGASDRSDVTFMSVHFWDEKSNGNWTLILRQHEYSNVDSRDFRIMSFTVTIYGTNKNVTSNNHGNDHSGHRNVKPTKQSNKEEPSFTEPSTDQQVEQETFNKTDYAPYVLYLYTMVAMICIPILMCKLLGERR